MFGSSQQAKQKQNKVRFHTLVMIVGGLLLVYGTAAYDHVGLSRAAAPLDSRLDSFYFQTTGSISGTVTDAGTGMPIPDMEVRLLGGGINQWVCTDDNGGYEFTDLPLNEVYQIISGGGNSACGGAADYVQTYWEDTRPWNETTLITLTIEAPTLTGIDIALSTGGSITGLVADAETGQPLPDMQVQLSGDDIRETTCTDENGVYQFNGLPLERAFRIGGGGSNVECGGAANYIQSYFQNTTDWDNATLITLTSGAPNLGGINLNLQTGGSISGTVIDAETGQPLSNVRVIFTGDEFYARACTDANGTYIMTGLPRNVALRVSSGGDNAACVGAANYVQSYWQNAADWDHATQITLTSELPDVTGVNFALQSGSSVAGNVTSAATGLPLAFIQVRVSSENVDKWVCTDGNGDYRVRGLPRNEPLLISTGGDNGECGETIAHIPVYWQDVFFEDEASLITLTATAPDLGGINFALQTGGSITGSVTDLDTGQPLGGMQVRLTSEKLNRWVCTDANGAYQFTGLPPGITVRVGSGGDNAACEGASNYMQIYWQQTFLWADAALITIADSESAFTDINFALQTGGSITGTVIDSATGLPVPNMRVLLSGDDFYPRACTDENGQYRISGLPLGMAFRVGTSSDVEDCGETPVYIPAYWQDTFLWDNATLITLSSAAPDVTGVDFWLQTGGTITGRVTDAETRQPIPNMRVFATSDDFYARVCTDSRGEYRIEQVPQGVDLRVASGGDNADCEGDPNYIQNYWLNTTEWDEAILVRLTADETDKVDVNFVLQTGGSIAGTVTDAATGQPLPNIQVRLSGETVHRSVCTGPDGQYQFLALPRDEELRVTSGGENGDCGEAAGYIVAYWRDTFLYGEATLVTLTGDASRATGINFALQVGGSIAGRVTDVETGRPLANMRVFATGDDFYARVCTDSRGEYQITDVPRGVPLRVGSGGDNATCDDTLNYIGNYWQDATGWNDATLITLTEAETEWADIDFALRTGGGVAGRVTDAGTGLPVANMQVEVSGEDVFERVCTDANGEYNIIGLPNDVAFRVRAGGENDACGGAVNYVLSYWDNTYDYGAATLLMLTDELPQVTEINFALEIGGSLSGAVINAEDGLPLPDMQVNVYYVDGTYYGACTDEEGKFELHPLPFDVAFRISTGGNSNRCGGSTEYFREFWEDRSSWGNAVLLSLTPERPTITDINLTPIWHYEYLREED